jgi:hypothetical protein
VSQEQWIIFAFKVVEVASVVTIAVFIACYSRWAAWFRNPIGRTIVYKDIALVLVLVPSILSIFINFNRLTSHIAAWFDVAAFAMVPVIMVWRTLVFRKIHKAGELPQDGDESGDHPC